MYAPYGNPSARMVGRPCRNLDMRRHDSHIGRYSETGRYSADVFFDADARGTASKQRSGILGQKTRKPSFVDGAKFKSHHRHPLL